MDWNRVQLATQASDSGALFPLAADLEGGSGGSRRLVANPPGPSEQRNALGAAAP